MRANQLIMAGAIMGMIMLAGPQAQADANWVLRVDPLSLIIGTHRHHHIYRPAPRPPVRYVHYRHPKPRRFGHYHHRRPHQHEVRSPFRSYDNHKKDRGWKKDKKWDGHDRRDNRDRNRGWERRRR